MDSHEWGVSGEMKEDHCIEHQPERSMTIYFTHHEKIAPLLPSSKAFGSSTMARRLLAAFRSRFLIYWAGPIREAIV